MKRLFVLLLASTLTFFAAAEEYTTRIEPLDGGALTDGLPPLAIIPCP